MKKITVLFLFFGVGLMAQNQQIKGIQTTTINIEADTFIGYDVFGALYFIKNNVLNKNKEALNWQYKNLGLGKISKVDLQNPLKIVLFYENFNTVVVLDNQLNETQQTNLSKNEVPIVASAVGLAFGNRLWIYNSLSQQIGLLDYLKNEYQNLTTPFKGSIKYYSSDFNSFQWVNEKSDWYRCDIYGKVTVVGKIPEFDQIEMVSDTDLIYKKNDCLYYFTVNGNKTTLIDFGKKTFVSFSYKAQILSIFTTQQITNYKITVP